MPKPNYSLLSKFEQEEKERVTFQNNCTHSFWSTRCGVCGKYLASDHHVNFHTPRGFKKDCRVAILILESGRAGELDLYRIQELKKIKHLYDELTVLVDSLDKLEVYSALKLVDRVNMNSLEEEVKHMHKYRRLDVKETSLILYVETPEKILDEFKAQCKRLKITSKIIDEEEKTYE